MAHLRILLGILIISFPLFSQAAVLIESRDGSNHLSRFFVEGDMARAEMGDGRGYVVIDLRNKTMKAVIHEQRMIMDMSEYMRDSSPATNPQVDANTRTQGLGPTIAGYETERYDIYNGEQFCGSAFLSVNAMHALDIRKFARAMANMSRNVKKTMGAFRQQFLDSCDEAQQKVSERLFDNGFPLRITNSGGKIMTSVVRINKQASLPANAFLIPADYRVTSPGQMMQQMQPAMQQMQQMMQNMTPEQREMMRKMMQGSQ